MHTRFISLAIAAAASACAAGQHYTQTSSSYTVTATASGEFNETQTGDALGTSSFVVGDGEANRWEAEAVMIAFLNDSIEIGAGAVSRTNTDSLVACSTQTSATIGFRIDAATLTTFRSTGPGSSWQIAADDGGTAVYSATVSGPGGVVFSRSAPSMAESFSLQAILQPGEYTYTVFSATSSDADGDPSTTSQGICSGGTRLEFAAAPSCNPADLSEPFGTLDLADINAFVAAFVAMDPIADLDGSTIYDLADISIFVGAFAAGCG